MAAAVPVPPPTPKHQIKSISLSTDNNFLLVSHSAGFDIFQLDPFNACFSLPDGFGGVQFAEQLDSTVLVALVGSGDQPHFSPRTLKLINSTTCQPVTSEDFAASTSIRRVKLNAARLLVVLETRFLIFPLAADLDWRKPLREEAFAFPNADGVCAFSRGAESLFAYPAVDQQQHVVVVYDAMNLRPRFSIPAHNSDIVCLAFNARSTLLATASRKGTLVRVFDLATKEMLYDFRRGTNPARIHSIAFSPDSTLLACSSDRASIHVFELNDANKTSTAGRLDSIAYWLPKSIGDALKPSIKQAQSVRSTKAFRLPFENVVSTLCFSANGQHLYAATHHGMLYAFAVDIANPYAGLDPLHSWVLIPSGPAPSLLPASPAPSAYDHTPATSPPNAYSHIADTADQHLAFQQPAPSTQPPSAYTAPTPYIQPSTGIPYTPSVQPSTGIPYTPSVQPSTGIPYSPSVQPSTGTPFSPTVQPTGTTFTPTGTTFTPTVQPVTPQFQQPYSPVSTPSTGYYPTPAATAAPPAPISLLPSTGRTPALVLSGPGAAITPSQP